MCNTCEKNCKTEKKKKSNTKKNSRAKNVKQLLE